MTPQSISAPEVVTFDDLKALAQVPGPCITMALVIPDPLQIHPRLKNSVRDMQKSLRDFGVDDQTAAALMAPVQSLASTLETEGQWRRDLVIFRSPDFFRYFSVLDLTRPFVDVGKQFQIRPLLSLVRVEQRFYVLALSQKHVRLVRATLHHAEEVPLEGIVPHNLETWLNARIPDHVLDNRASGGPSTGSMKGVMFTTSADQERRGEYLAHFFREIDSGMRKILDGAAPLILAGVAAETKLYARENTYPRLLEEAIQGSPEKLTLNELHQRAMDIARHAYTPLLAKALHDVKQQRSAGGIVAGTDPVLKAAFQGRVAELLVREDQEWRGVWDEVSQEVRPGDEDLLNLAALQTLSHGGRAFALPASDMPEAGTMMAVLRF